MTVHKTALLEKMHGWNPWWEGRSFSLPGFRRWPFQILKDGLRVGKVQVLAGPRQTGKTTLLRQLMVDLHSKGVPPNHTLYLPLDGFADELQKGGTNLRELLQIFSEEIAKLPLGEGDKFIFLDEVHNYPPWNREVKVLHDQQTPLHLVVSGSASALVLKDAATALAGRSVEHVILPLSFGDTLEAKLEPTTWRALKTAQAAVGRIFLDVFENDEKQLRRSVASLLTDLAGHASMLRAELTRYLRRGGFPEPVLKNLSDEETDLRLQTILDQMIRRDFVDFFHVRDTKTLERTIRIVAQNTGRVLSERKLCTDLGVALNTVRNHIGFLEKAYIVFAARALAGSVSSQSRISEKLFFLDPGLRNSLVGYQTQDKGGLLESAVYVHLWSFFKKHRPSVELLYWRKKDVEVDIVLRQGRALIGIEVHVSDDDVHGLKWFLEEKPSALGILVSDVQPPNVEDRIIVIPPPLLFLL